MITLFKMKHYINNKEEHKWKPDVDGDNKMDFYEAWAPMFVFISFYVMKLFCCRVQYALIKFLMCVSVIVFAWLGESHFDRNKENDAPIWLLSIPITVFILG